MFDFKEKNDGKWFYFDDSDIEAGGIKVRLLPAEEAEKIYKATTKRTEKIVVDKQLFKDRIGDDDAAYSRVLDFTIVDWKGVLWGGKPLDCTAPNKVKLLKKSTAFRKFYEEAIKQLEEADADFEAKRVKNLNDSSDGK